MRRQRRSHDQQGELDIKKIAFIGIGIALVIAIIAIVGYNMQQDNQIKQAKTQYSKNQVNSLTNHTFENQTTEQASSSIGKSVNESQNETIINITKADNTAKETNANQTTEENTTIENADVEDNEVEETNAPEEKQENTADPTFASPLDGEISQEFAKDKLVYSNTLKEWVTHSGIDIKAPKTTVVKAASDGKVKSIKNDPRYGLTVVLEHNNGFTSVYSNLLTAEFVKVGEEIKQGQTIATVGTSATFEVADEPHLHFEILKDNVVIDPGMYLK